MEGVLKWNAPKISSEHTHAQRERERVSPLIKQDECEVKRWQQPNKRAKSENWQNEYLLHDRM